MNEQNIALKLDDVEFRRRRRVILTKVNLEVDVLARYIERLLLGDKAAEATQQSKISMDFLAENGFLK